MSTAEELFGLIRARRSIRHFRPEPVGREMLERLIELAAWAPSAGNRKQSRTLTKTSKHTLSNARYHPHSVLVVDLA